MIIDFGSTHNFIDKRLPKNLNCLVYPVINFQVVLLIEGVLIVWENATILN